MRETDERLRALGVDSTYGEMDSDYGHYAFLLEQEKMIPPLSEFMARVGSTADDVKAA